VNRTVRTWLFLVGAVAVIVVAALVAGGADDGVRTADDRVHEIAAGLRCPVCQNLSVADSPSRLAGEMRAEIADKLAAGQTPEQIRAFFVDRYGEWVLLAPTKEGLNLLPWAVPIVGVLAGAAVWFLLVRRRPDRDRPAVEAGDPVGGRS
jgi:cytochrome c-type biogenesis protein CcmH